MTLFNVPPVQMLTHTASKSKFELDDFNGYNFNSVVILSICFIFHNRKQDMWTQDAFNTLLTKQALAKKHFIGCQQYRSTFTFNRHLLGPLCGDYCATITKTKKIQVYHCNSFEISHTVNVPLQDLARFSVKNIPR